MAPAKEKDCLMFNIVCHKSDHSSISECTVLYSEPLFVNKSRETQWRFVPAFSAAATAHPNGADKKL
jgi:hypothetical protein